MITRIDTDAMRSDVSTRGQARAPGDGSQCASAFWRRIDRPPVRWGLGAVAAMFAVAWPIFIWLFPAPHALTSDPAILGRWLSQYEYPDSAGMVKLRGVSEFFENHTYSYIGELSYTATGTAPPVTMLFRLHATGEWGGSNTRVITKLIHLQAPLVAASAGDITFTGNEVKKMTGGEVPSLSDVLPMGLSEHYDIVSLQSDRMAWLTQDLAGRPLMIEMTRTSKRSP